MLSALTRKTKGQPKKEDECESAEKAELSKIINEWMNNKQIGLLIRPSFSSAVCLWVTYLVSPSFSFFRCKKEVITPTSTDVKRIRDCV